MYYISEIVIHFFYSNASWCLNMLPTLSVSWKTIGKIKKLICKNVSLLYLIQYNEKETIFSWKKHIFYMSFQCNYIALIKWPTGHLKVKLRINIKCCFVCIQVSVSVLSNVFNLKKYIMLYKLQTIFFSRKLCTIKKNILQDLK